MILNAKSSLSMNNKRRYLIIQTSKTRASPLVRTCYSVLLLAFIAGFMTLIHGPAHATMTEWQDLGGGKARLVAEYDPLTRRLSGGLELKLESGWSTYWRYPGSSGIPPVFDFGKTLKLDPGKPEFPVPEVIGTGQNRYAGYKQQVTFPFSGEFDPASNGGLQLQLMIGLCETICIPARAVFRISETDLRRFEPETKRVLAQAQATLPTLIGDPAPLILKERTKDAEIRLVVKPMPGFEKPELLVEGPSEWFLTPALSERSTDEAFVFLLDVSRAPGETDFLNTPLHYTLVEGRRGVQFQD